MVKQFANEPFANGPFGFHIYTDSEWLASVQKTVVVEFALFLHLLCGLGLNSKICICLSPHPSKMTILSFTTALKPILCNRLV